MTLNIVFAGTPEFCLPSLNALKDSEHTLKAIYTQPDRKAGRGLKLQASAVKDWALKHNIPTYQPLNFKTQEAVEELQTLKPDVLVVIAYGLILPQSVLDIPRLGCINVHASLLPRWRGASPIQQAILHGDAQSGVTIMQMDAGMDTGAMLEQVAYELKSSETTASLHNQLADLAAKPLLNTLHNLSINQAQPVIQDPEQVTYAAKINKEEAQINWQDSATIIDRKIRAFHPWPIAYTQLEDEILRIHQAQILKLDQHYLPGTIISIDKKGLLVAAAEDALLIDKIQFPGSKVISVSDWLNSGKATLHVGSLLQ